MITKLKNKERQFLLTKRLKKQILFHFIIV